LKTMMATPRQTWDERRNNFVARHMAQVNLRGEQLYEQSGKYKGWPTRRHLGLIMWAMTPDPRGVGNLIARERGLKTTRANGLSSRRSSGRASTGRGIRIPAAWIDRVEQAIEFLETHIPEYTARYGLDEPRAEGFINLPLDAPGLSPKIRALFADQPGKVLNVKVALYAQTPERWKERGVNAVYWGNQNMLMFAVGDTSRDLIRHELVHAIQNNADLRLVDMGRAPEALFAGPDSMVGQRRAYWRHGAPRRGAASTPVEFEAYLGTALDEVRDMVNSHYNIQIAYLIDPDTTPAEDLTSDERITPVNAQVRFYAADKAELMFDDPRARRDAMKRIADEGARAIAEREEIYAAWYQRTRGKPLRPNGRRKPSTARTNGLSRRRSSGRATGRGIRVPQAWISQIDALVEPGGELDKVVGSAMAPCSRCGTLTKTREKSCAACGAARSSPPSPNTRASKHLTLWLGAPGLSPRVRDLLAPFTATQPGHLPIEVTLYVGRVPDEAVGTAGGRYWDLTVSIAGGLNHRDRVRVIRHELVHMIQHVASLFLGPDPLTLPPEKYDEKSRPSTWQVGVRRAHWKAGRAPAKHAASTPVEFEAYLSEFLANLDRTLQIQYRTAFSPGLRVRKGNAIVREFLRDENARLTRLFPDARTRKAAVKRIADAGARKIAEMEAELNAPQTPSVVANPRYTSARRDDPELWEEVKAEITRGTKGGKAGQWSARKAQFAVAEYQRRGGGYIGPKSPRNALAKWTREEWGTKSGRASLKTGERYLPKAAREALSSEEYAETTRAKRAGLRRGEQFTRQPKRIARKTAKYRK